MPYVQTRGNAIFLRLPSCIIPNYFSVETPVSVKFVFDWLLENDWFKIQCEIQCFFYKIKNMKFTKTVLSSAHNIFKVTI